MRSDVVMLAIWLLSRVVSSTCECREHTRTDKPDVRGHGRCRVRHQRRQRGGDVRRGDVEGVSQQGQVGGEVGGDPHEACAPLGAPERRVVRTDAGHRGIADAR
jgi:hypothetical protein